MRSIQRHRPRTKAVLWTRTMHLFWYFNMLLYSDILRKIIWPSALLHLIRIDEKLDVAGMQLAFRQLSPAATKWPLTFCQTFAFIWLRTLISLSLTLSSKSPVLLRKNRQRVPHWCPRQARHFRRPSMSFGHITPNKTSASNDRQHGWSHTIHGRDRPHRATQKTGISDLSASKL